MSDDDNYIDDFIDIDKLNIDNNNLKLTVSNLTSKISDLEILLRNERIKNRRNKDNNNEVDIDKDKKIVDISTLKVSEVLYASLEIGIQLASGGSGLIYLTKYYGSTVVLKRYFDPLLTEQLRSEFLNEVKISSILRHPNVVNYIGCCLKPPYLCILNEYMCNGSLYNLLHLKRVVLKPEITISIAKNIISSISYMHNLSILHHDIKSANILLDQNYTAKLCDFGQSRYENESISGGTLQYCAPEIIFESKYSKASDIYSLGILLGELFTSEVPFDGEDIKECLKLLKRPNLKNVDEKWNKLISKCVVQNPKDRPTIDQVRKECENY